MRYDGTLFKRGQPQLSHGPIEQHLHHYVSRRHHILPHQPAATGGGEGRVRWCVWGGGGGKEPSF